IERSIVFGNFDTSDSKNIMVRNSELTIPNIGERITKENSVARLHGKNRMGTGRITDVKNVTNLSTNDFLYYDQMSVQITAQINDKTVAFNINADINSSIVDLIGYAQHAGIIYLCAFHYVKDNADNTTIDFYKVPSMNKVLPTS